MLRFDVALVYFFVFFKPATAVIITNTDFSGIQTGSPFTINWTDASGPVTILLKSGNSTNFNDLKAVAIWVDLPGTSYVWTPAPILQTGPYRLELADSAVEPTYSPQFMLTNVGGTTSSSPTTTSSNPTTTFLTSTSTTPSSLQSTSTPSSPTSSLSSIITSTPTSISAANTTTTENLEPTATPHARLSKPVKAGISICLLFVVILTSYFAISLLIQRFNRKKSAEVAKSGDRITPKDPDLEHGINGGKIEMSGALDSASSVGVSSRDPSSRRPSTRPPTAEEIREPEPEPVEIGSSGYGKEMSGVEKGKAVELEANQKVKFEERKRRRRGVKLTVGRLRILL